MFDVLQGTHRDVPEVRKDALSVDVRRALREILDRSQIARNHGDRIVEIESPSLFEEMRSHRWGRFRGSFARHLRRVRLGDYLEQLAAGSSDEYLTQWALPDVLDTEIRMRMEDLGSKPTGPLHLYIGPALAVTPLHFDFCDARIDQIEGVKRWSCLAPSSLPRHQRLPLTSQVRHFSRVLDQTDLERLERQAGVTPQRLEVGSGESIHVPAGWWHFVENLTVSVSLHRFVPTPSQRRRAKLVAPWRALLGQRFLSESAARNL